MPESLLPSRDVGLKAHGMKKRLAFADRTRSIVQAATVVFAEHGFERTTTKQLALAAKVSPALLYEHFPSKEALYRAVLRQLIKDQDALLATLAVRRPGEEPDGATGLIVMLHSYFSACVLTNARDRNVTAHRLLLRSLASDGTYARLLYRRSLRNNVNGLATALDGARTHGQITGEAFSAPTAAAFIEHVGSMLLSTHLSDKPIALYTETGNELVKKAVFFCGRGLGLANETISRIYELRGL